MKLNGLTNNLKGNDNSLSNSYLSHIVELLRQEVEALSVKENALEEITNEHIETQKVLVDTKEVKSESVNTNKLQVTSINEKIILSNVIDVLTSLRVNGKDVLTEATFQGPFTYKGVVETLPETAEAGDVYISNDKVNIFNGTTWDDFILPVGTVSLAEYNKDKVEILSDISTIRNDLNTTKSDLANFKADTETAIGTIFTDLTEVNTKLENKVDEAPKDANAYVRKNGEWIEQTTADNTVKSVAGESTIDNTEVSVSINSPKVEINTLDFKVNGTDLPEVDKLGLSKTTEVGTDYYYEMKFGRSPYKSVSSIQQGWCTFGDSYQECVKTPSEKYSIFTKNWQYCKFNLSGATGGDNQSIEITAMDKDGNINNIQSVWTDWIEPTSVHLQIASFFTFNQEYVPEGWDDTVWLFCTGLGTTHSQNKPYLIELKDGEFSRKIDVYNGVGKLKEQGYVPYLSAPACSHYLSTGCGKGLRSKTINRICWVSMNVGNEGGNYALIIGGDKNSAVTDPFDPSKVIYIPLPANAYYSYNCMAATDSAWYLQENGTGRMMRITPDGQVSEINLTETVTSCGFNYIEYTDKNNKPACAYYVHKNSSGGGHYVVFLEEEEGSQVNFIERKVTSDAFTPTGSQWYAQQFKFMENSHYIFFTADCGNSVPDGDTNYGSASMKNILWYWDKATHTTHSINNFYEGITRSWDKGFIEMHKTKGNAIWFPYIIQDLAATERTGELHFISDIDYTNIDENGKDIGEIQVQTATVGTNHSFFTCGSDYTNAWQDYYTHPLQGEPAWGKGGTRNQLSATNDDGILCVMAADLKAYALCYGDGNIKVYECSKNSSDGRYNCDPDKVPIVPDEPSSGNAWWAGHACLFGMTHGWVLSVSPITVQNLWSYDAPQYRSYTYIGIQYRNGEPTILAEPHLSKIQRTGSVSFPQRTKFEKYDYLQTYDDYERRKKVLGEIRANLQYCVGSTGTDSYFKEVRKEKKLINLLYDNKVISSIEQ